MAKLSITLPNNTQITLEWEESGSVHDVLGPVLREMQQDTQLEDMPAPADRPDGPVSVEKSNGAIGIPDVQSSPAPQRRSNGAAPTRASNGISHASNGAPSYGEDARFASPNGELENAIFDLGRYSQQVREDFTAFCLSINTTGDMRRVVVAAEAANRFFGLEGVTADELGELFDLVGWRRANSFTQTIRNAARAKFRWLERIPGRSGRYAATEFGRATTLSG